MGFLTGTVLFFFVLNCLFLIGLVLLQSGKGNSLNMMGGASQSTFGSSTTDVLTKTTRVIAISFIVFSLFLSFLFAKKEEVLPIPDTEETSVIKQIEPKTETKDSNPLPTPEKP
jgi:preprotein translocase subunit SecG